MTRTGAGSAWLMVSFLIGGSSSAESGVKKSHLDMGVLLSTPFTQVDTDGDGRVDLTREFDGSGVLRRLEWSSPDSGRTWKIIWYRKPSGAGVERVLELHSMGKLIASSKDIMSAGGERLTRERIQYADQEPRRLVRDLFLKNERLTQAYAAKGGRRWRGSEIERVFLLFRSG